MANYYTDIPELKVSLEQSMMERNLRTQRTQLQR